MGQASGSNRDSGLAGAAAPLLSLAAPSPPLESRAPLCPCRTDGPPQAAAAAGFHNCVGWGISGASPTSPRVSPDMQVSIACTEQNLRSRSSDDRLCGGGGVGVGGGRGGQGNAGYQPPPGKGARLLMGPRAPGQNLPHIAFLLRESTGRATGMNYRYAMLTAAAGLGGSTESEGCSGAQSEEEKGGKLLPWTPARPVRSQDHAAAKRSC